MLIIDKTVQNVQKFCRHSWVNHFTLALIVTSSFFIYIQLHGKQCKEGFRIDGGRIYLNSIYFNLKTWNLQVSGFCCSGRAFIQYTYIILERRSGLSDLESTSEKSPYILVLQKKSACPIQSSNKLFHSFSYFKPRTSYSSLTQKNTHFPSLTLILIISLDTHNLIRYSLSYLEIHLLLVLV